MIPIRGAKLPTRGILSWGYQRTDEHKHRGIDLPAPKGTPVLAAASGVVTHAYTTLAPGFSGYGRVVVVKHGKSGPWQLYAHLDKVYVVKGQTVKEGQQVGTVGTTCFRDSDPDAQCAAHLHFEVSPRAYPQPSEAPRMDPVAWLQGGIGIFGLAVLGGGGWWAWKNRKRWLR